MTFRASPEFQRAREIADAIAQQPTPTQRRLTIKAWCRAMIEAIEKERRPQLKLM